jgi:hypothetical protein
VHFQKQIIDLGVFFNCGDREMRDLMKRYKDWVEIFYRRYLMPCVEMKDTVMDFLCLIIKKGLAMHPLLHYCGPLDHVCQHCGAFGFDGENKATKKNEVHFGNMCCNQGKVRIEPLPKLPPKIEEMYKGKPEASKLFLRNIRNYNAQFAFGSLQVNENL